MELEPLSDEFIVGQIIRYQLRDPAPPDNGNRTYDWTVRPLGSEDAIRSGTLDGGAVESPWMIPIDPPDREDPGRDRPIGVGRYTLKVQVANRERSIETVFDVRPVPTVRVELQRSQPTQDLPLGPTLTFDGFVDKVHGKKQLKSKKASTVPATNTHMLLSGPQPTPRFGRGPEAYDKLIQQARDYARKCTVTDVSDLYPAGYPGQVIRDQNLSWDGTGAHLPGVELIWNYWEEEGMLVQTMNHIVARFQNRRVSGRDPLARFDVSPLIPLRSLLWNWVENEQKRLTVRRRAAEYQYEYGLSLIGRAVPAQGLYVERRSNFLAAYHTVLYLASEFFRALDNLTIKPDGFPLYEALRECHLVLSQGTQNGYGDTAIQARAEMLVMQYILAQPQMREFLGGRPMTPYQEPWMDRIDSMKAIQGWSDTSIMHFHDLATFGERLVLTIRLGNWNDSSKDGREAASTWAQGFRPMIQRYIGAYRAVTGVDLADGVDATMPSTLIARRMSETRLRA